VGPGIPAPQRTTHNLVVTPITFAHRGARADLPENTLPAFRRARAGGASGLESDVHLSADGDVVLVHDPVIRRGWRRVRVAATATAELAELDVPRLDDLYAALGSDYELSLDLKADDVAGPVLSAAARVGAVDRLWLCAPSVRSLQSIRELHPTVHLVHSTQRRALSEPLERYASDLTEWGIDVVNLHHSEWTAGLVELFHRFDRRAFAWDVQEVRHIRAALAMGIDAVYSDHVDRMVATVAEWE
jgi:glycerophosphoryl diester phosphodiesterase